MLYFTHVLAVLLSNINQNQQCGSPSEKYNYCKVTTMKLQILKMLQYLQETLFVLKSHY